MSKPDPATPISNSIAERVMRGTLDWIEKDVGKDPETFAKVIHRLRLAANFAWTEATDKRPVWTKVMQLLEKVEDEMDEVRNPEET